MRSGQADAAATSTGPRRRRRRAARPGRGLERPSPRHAATTAGATWSHLRATPAATAARWSAEAGWCSSAVLALLRRGRLWPWRLAQAAGQGQHVRANHQHRPSSTPARPASTTGAVVLEAVARHTASMPSTWPMRATRMTTRLHNAINGQSASSWTSQDYRTASLGNLKAGTGLDPGHGPRPIKLSSITVQVRCVQRTDRGRADQEWAPRTHRRSAQGQPEPDAQLRRQKDNIGGTPLTSP